MRTELWFGTEGAFDHILRGKSRFQRDQAPSLIYSFTRHLLSAYYALDAGIGNYKVSQTDKVHPLKELTFSWGMGEQKINK